MRVHYDIEATNPEELKNYSNEAKEILAIIKSFIIQRFSVLEEEMEKEWIENKAFVALIAPKSEGEQFQIGYPKFSENLKGKLESCLSDEDFVYLNSLLNT